MGHYRDTWALPLGKQDNAQRTVYVWPGGGGGVGTEGYLIKLGSEKAFLEGVMSNRILKQ